MRAGFLHKNSQTVLADAHTKNFSILALDNCAFNICQFKLFADGACAFMNLR
jgi:hypothetical protein